MQNLGQDSSPEREKGEQMMSGRGETSSNARKPSTPHSSNNSSPTKSDTDHLSEITTPRFLSDSSESEDEDVSLVESFVIDQVADLDETEARIQTSKFLLTQEEVDSTVDPETQARLEALLEAAGIGKLATGDGKQLADPEVLRRLTSSVSCALDEAAAALTRMRSENSRPQPERSLVEACSDGDVGTVRKLLTEGRSVHETTDDGESLLSLACSAGYYELAQVLLAMHANVEDRGIKGDCTPLMEAASSGYVDIVRLLIHHGAEVNAQSSSGNTPLMYACAGGHVEAVRVLLDAGANVEEHNENGHTPLMEAASAGHVPVAEILLERGAGINTHSNEFKESALTLACYKGHLDMVRFLLEAGADQEHKTDEMHTALMEASMDGHVEVARLLLDSGAQVNMPTDSFESPLTLAACGGHVELAVLLIERGANIEEVNDEGYTPLMEAAREGHEDMVALLLSKGANINAQTEETQETALTLACCGGFLEVANFLIANGAEIELGASTPLMEAAQEGHLELVKYLLDKNADVNAQTQTGDTALTYACENGHTEVARLLLQYGADLEHESEGGRTPLMKACRAGHACTVRFLLSQNANVNKQTTNNDHTPLSLAAGGGHLAVVELLLSQSANPFHKLKDNSTMLIEAAKGGHTNVVQLLLDYPHSIMMKGESAAVAAQQQHVHEHLHHEEPKPPPAAGRVTDQPQPPSAAPAPTGQKPSMGQHPTATSTTNATNSSNVNAAATVAAAAAAVQKSVLRKSRQSAALDSNTLTSPEAQQVRNQPPLPPHGIAPGSNTEVGVSGVVGSMIEDLQDAASLTSHEANQGVPLIAKPPTTLSLETQFFQRQQIVEELQRVEQELKERGARAGLLDGRPLSPTGTFSNLIMPTTPPGPPPDSSTQGLSLAGLGEAAVAGELIQLFCEGMVCGSTGVFAGTSTPGGTTGIVGANTAAAAAAAQGLLVQPQSSACAALATSPINPGSPALAGGHQPITTPSEVVQATAISDRPKAKPAWKKEGKTLRKQAAALQAAAFQAALHQQQQYFDQSTIQHLKNLVQKTEETGTVPRQAGGGASGVGVSPSGLVADPSAVAAVAAAAAQGKSVFSANHIMAHVTQQLDMTHLSGHDSQLRSQQDVLSGQCDLMQRRCPLLSQVDEDALIELAKAGKLDQERLDSLTEEDVRVLQSVEEMANSAYFTLLRGSNGNYQLPCQELQNQLPDKTQVGPTSGRGGSGAVGGIVDLNQPPQQLQQLCSSAAPSLSSSILAPPATQSVAGSGVPNVSPTPPQFQPQLLLKAPPPWVKDNSGLATNAVPAGAALTTGGHVQAGTQTSPATEAAPPPATVTTTKKISHGVTAASTVQQQAQQQSSPPQQQAGQQQATNGASPVFSVTTTTKRGKKYHYQPKSTQAPPVHSDSEHCFRCDGQAGAQGITPTFGMDVDSATDSNNDTALTLACAGGHEELVELLLSRGANIEHRDKKGFTPLILAATAGHDKVVEILMNHSADMEAQSERTKDTPLSLACSGGRYEVVELLLSKGANKEHRNVSDYTPLSLAASGGYVNIIKLLLQHGAEINSRTGSKLGISPLMLAAMNGHTAAVKLLLDMGSDINAQIETNRNTALTLACFQGRHEVVSLLLDRRANVEHRAKTGLTPLMEAASGGYVEVGRVLLDKGADVNAPPVPSSRDTALTIAADKGHCRFVELLLNRAAQVEVKNKKGNSPLWLAANGGHIAVVELLYNAGADIDSQDNRKVSCLMAAFRKGHVKVVKWMVNHVVQFPSDQEMTRFISTVNDKELLEKCQECTKIIRAAKDQQAAKANKNASILLEELFMEKTREESKRAAAARRRERKKKKKMEKKEEKRKLQEENQKNERFAAEDDDDEEDQDDEDEEKPDIKEIKKTVEVAGTSESPARGVAGVNGEGEEGDSGIDANSQGSCSSNEVKGGGAGRRKEKKKKRPNSVNNVSAVSGSGTPSTVSTSSNQPGSSIQPSTSKLDERNTNRSITSSNLNTSGSSSSSVKNVKDSTGSTSSGKVSDKSDKSRQSANNSNLNSNNKSASKAQQALVFEPTRHPADREDFEATGNETYVSTKGKKISYLNYCDEVLPAANIKNTSSTSPKQAGKRDEGWKEVVRKFMNSPFKSKKVSVPLNAISRVIGRGGSNINAIRTATGAHIEVEKQSKGQGERIITLKGSPDAIKQAHSLIAALIKDPDVDILQILPKSANKSAAAVWEKSVNTAKSKPSNKAQANQLSTASAKTTIVGSVASTAPSLLQPRTTGAPVSRVTAPRLVAAAAKRQMSATSNTKTTMSYTSVIMTSNRLTPNGAPSTSIGNTVGAPGSGPTFAAKLSAEAQAASIASGNVSGIGLTSLSGLGVIQSSHLVPSMPVSLSAASVAVSVTGPCVATAMVTPPSPQQLRQQQSTPPAQAITPPVPSKQMTSSSPLPSVVIATSSGSLMGCSPPPPPPSSTPGAAVTNGSPSSIASNSSNSAATLVEYSLFNDGYTPQSMWGREGDSQKGMNFASATASSASNSSAVIMPPQSNKFLDPSPPKVDASKAPGYRGNTVCSPVSKGCGSSSAPIAASTSTSSSSSANPTGITVVPSPYFTAPPPSVTHSSEPSGPPSSYRAPPPSSAYPQAQQHPPPPDPLDHSAFHPSSVSMSRLNPRAPDFSTSFKPQQIYQSTANNASGGAYLQQNLLPNSNVIFPIGKFPGNRPNGQARWPLMTHGYPQSDMAHLASLAMSQTDLLGPLENGVSSNVSPSSPQAPPQADDRKIPPRPIGTERAWKNYGMSMTSTNVPQELDLTGPQWLIEPKLNWQAATTAAAAAVGAAACPGAATGGLDSRHHIFRGTPNPGPPPPPIGPPYSRISLAEDMTHIMDTTYQGGLDGGQFSNGGGISLMHALPVMNQQQHHYAAAMAAAAAVGQDLTGGGGGVTGGPADWDQTPPRHPSTIQELHQDKTHYYSTNQGWNKWNH